MLSPSKAHNHVSLMAASAKPAILVNAPKFDTGANTFLLFSQGERKLFLYSTDQHRFFPPYSC